MIIVITQRIDNPVYVFLTQICPPESAFLVNSFFNEIVPQPLRNVFKMCICNYLVAIVSICAYIVYSAFTENDGSRLKFVNACFADQALIEEWYIPFLCVGIIALLAGVLFNDKFEKFN